MEAMLYDSLKDKNVLCNLCNHRCIIKNSGRGICNVRENRDGILVSLIYGRLIAQHVDPIEKKPLFHFMPGSLSFSIATVGCNFKCLFCQNADIAQMPFDRDGMIAGEYCSPASVVERAKKTGCKSISHTYTEPTINFEFILETAKLAHAEGMSNILVTNGYMTAQALEIIGQYIDAANIDLKAFSPEFYKRYCGAKLEHVKDTLKLMKSAGIFVEVTTLLIPGLNDDVDEISNLASFIAESLGTETPWHVSRFHPTYRLTDRPPTPLATLVKARKTGIEAGLRYVYTGNVPGENGENTFCDNCGKVLIDRWGFNMKKNLIEKGLCPDCGAEIDGVWAE